MRDPLAPIPSPFGRSPRTDKYWGPPPPSSMAATVTAAPPPQSPALPDPALPDPSRWLGRDEDQRGVDRRSRRRHGDGALPASVTTPVTAAQHVPLDHFVGLRCSHGWALTEALAISDTGILLRHYDLLDGTADPEERGRARRALRRVAAEIAGNTRAVSPMSLVSGCVLSRTVVADLARGANADRPPEIEHWPMIRLVVPAPAVRVGRRSLAAGTGSDPASPPEGGWASTLEIPGEVVALTDPAPEIVGVALAPRDLRRLRRVLLGS